MLTGMYLRACMLSHFSCVQLFVTLWTVAHQPPLSMRFSRQEYWRGLPCPPLRDLPDLGIKPESLLSPVLAGRFFTTSATWETLSKYQSLLYKHQSKIHRKYNYYVVFEYYLINTKMNVSWGSQVTLKLWVGWLPLWVWELREAKKTELLTLLQWARWYAVLE